MSSISGKFEFYQESAKKDAIKNSIEKGQEILQPLEKTGHLLLKMRIIFPL